MASKSTKSLQLIEEVLSLLQERPMGYVTNVVRKLELVADLMDDRQLRHWCNFNLGQYEKYMPKLDPKGGPNAVDDFGKKMTAKFDELSFRPSYEEIITRLSNSACSFKSVEFLENRLAQLHKQKKGNDGQHYVLNLERALIEIANAASKYATKLYTNLSFGEIPSRQFDVIRERVDSLLLDVCPEAVEQFMRAYERLASGNAEDWSLALTACRRIMKAVADAVYPPRDGLLNGREVGDAQYMNRLWAFMDEHVPASSDKDLAKAHFEYIGSFLKRLHEKASKGVHAKVEYDEAVRSVLYTYLTLGDLLDLAPRAIATSLARDERLDINSASSDALAKLPGFNKGIAKEIIRRRVVKPFVRVEELTEIRGIGPKMLERARSRIIAIAPTVERP